MFVAQGKTFFSFQVSDENNQDLNIDQNNINFCHNQAALEVTLWRWLFQV